MIYRVASFIYCISIYFLFTYTNVVISGFFVGLPNPLFFFVVIKSSILLFFNNHFAFLKYTNQILGRILLQELHG